MSDSSGRWLYAMLHVEGSNPCGGRAALMAEIPKAGSVLLSAQFRKLDGSRFLYQSVPICGSCERRFRPVRNGIKYEGA